MIVVVAAVVVAALVVVALVVVATVADDAWTVVDLVADAWAVPAWAVAASLHFVVAAVVVVVAYSSCAAA